MTEAAEPLREVIARHGLQARKSLGQNFILDRQLLDRIAAVPGPLAGQSAYEVGPGPGGLTLGRHASRPLCAVRRMPGRPASSGPSPARLDARRSVL